MPRWITLGVSLWLIGGSPMAALANEPPPPASPSPAVDAAHAEAIKKLLMTMGVAKNSAILLDRMMETMRPMAPELSDDVWNALLAEMKGEFSYDRLCALYVPIYAKYLTLEDVQAMQAYYDSPAGRKYIEVMPMLLQDSMAVGRQIGEEATERVFQRIESAKERHEAPQPPTPSP